DTGAGNPGSHGALWGYDARRVGQRRAGDADRGQQMRAWPRPAPIGLSQRGHQDMAENPMFARKPLKLLMHESGRHQLARVLGPVQLTALGIGAIIGTGIFVLTGKAAHDTTGPALMLSFVVAGMACVFAALCYAEFASMVPIAGSAYTY